MARGIRKTRENLDDLSRLFLELRERAGLIQPEAARHASVSQSMLSRVETGRKVPDIATTRALAALYQATPDERARLIELVTLMEPARLDSRLVMQRGKNLHFQERIRAIEQSSALVRAYQPGVILGMLQTPTYARAVFTAPRSSRPTNSDSPAALAATRASHYRQLAEDTHRQWTLLHTEGALNWHIESPAVMVAQLEQLIEASQLPHVRLGIIPARTPSRVFAPHGFHLYDRRAVQVGTKTATALSENADDLQDYENLFGELERMAAYDDPARELLQRVADAYRELGAS